MLLLLLVLEKQTELCNFSSRWCNVPLLEERDAREGGGPILDNGAISTQLSFCTGSSLEIATFPL